ncbi:MAG: hypothetical protein ACT6Q3_01735 [Sphingopyxis sp.]
MTALKWSMSAMSSAAGRPWSAQADGNHQRDQSEREADRIDAPDYAGIDEQEPEEDGHRHGADDRHRAARHGDAIMGDDRADEQATGEEIAEIGGNPLQLHRQHRAKILDQEGGGGDRMAGGGGEEVAIFAAVEPEQQEGARQQQADARIEQGNEKLTRQTLTASRTQRNKIRDNKPLRGQWESDEAVNR